MPAKSMTPVSPAALVNMANPDDLQLDAKNPRLADYALSDVPTQPELLT